MADFYNSTAKAFRGQEIADMSQHLTSPGSKNANRYCGYDTCTRALGPDATLVASSIGPRLVKWQGTSIQAQSFRLFESLLSS